MSRSSSRRLLVTTVAATSVALLASACGKSSAQPGAASGAPTTPATSVAGPAAGSASPAAASSSASPAGPQYAVGTPLISDGSATVTIGGKPVTFPTTVQEASWSPDGSRIAFIDASGDVATARPDGSDVVVLVKPAQGSKLTGPAWQGGTVLYTEQNAAGTHFVRQATTVGQADHTDGDLYSVPDKQTGAPQNLTDTSNPVGLARQTVTETRWTLAFQTSSAKGPELWVHVQDSNSRGGIDPAEQFASGTWPALNPSGDVAFVGSGGGIEVVTADALAKAYNTTPTATKVADAGAGATHLAWTPDGKSIAYSTPDGIMEVAAGQPGATPTQLSAKPGVVSFLPAASDRIVPLSGTSPTDLPGASVAISQHWWLTQTGTTPAPAGAGPHGPYAMSVRIVAADDVATAQKEYAWGGLYGPTLLSTAQGSGQGALDPRLTAEVKRVLGKPNTQDTFAGVDTVFLVGAPSAFPSSDDAAITKLGYKVVHVSAAPKQYPADVTPPPVAVVDPADPAALSEAKADGAHVIQLANGTISAADTAYLTGVDQNFQYAPPQLVAFGDKAFTAAAALKLQHIAPPTEALGDTHADFLAATAMAAPTTSTLTLAPATSPADLLLAEISTPQIGARPYNAATVTVDPAQGLSPTLKALLEERSASISELDVVDTGSALPANVLSQLGTLISGPLGAQTVPNQTADALAKAEGVVLGQGE